MWINSYIAQESKIFDEGVEGGYFIKRSDGSVWQYDAWVRLMHNGYSFYLNYDPKC